MASAASQGMVAIATLLAARACDPALFGVLGVFTTLVVIGGTIASLRLEAAVVLPARDADARRLATVGLLAAPVVAAVVAITMLVVGPAVLPRFDAEGLLAHPWAIPTAVLVLGWRSLMLGWCTRHGHVRAIAHGRLANGGAMSIGLLAAATVSPTLGVLLAAWIAGQAAEAVVLGARTLGDPNFLGPARRPLRTRRLLTRYRRFPMVQLWSFLIEQLGPHLPTALIAGAFSAEIAGVYSIISRIVARPMAVIGSSIAVVVQHQAGVNRRARQPLRPVLAAGLRRLALAAMIIFIPIAAIGPWILPRILGPDWIEPGRALLAVLPGVVADFIAIPLLPVLGIVERLGTQLAGGLVRLTLVAGAIATLGGTDAPPIVMMVTVSGVIVVIDLAMMRLAWRAADSVIANPSPRAN
ncbi:MAG: hypothetical protein RLZZ461_18 [Planctomycetota bacterium]|jgi:O-antigen/teichoic acid export membrane protein